MDKRRYNFLFRKRLNDAFGNPSDGKSSYTFRIRRGYASFSARCFADRLRTGFPCVPHSRQHSLPSTARHRRQPGLVISYPEQRAMEFLFQSGIRGRRHGILSGMVLFHAARSIRVFHDPASRWKPNQLRIPESPHATRQRFRRSDGSGRLLPQYHPVHGDRGNASEPRGMRGGDTFEQLRFPEYKDHVRNVFHKANGVTIQCTYQKRKRWLRLLLTQSKPCHLHKRNTSRYPTRIDRYSEAESSITTRRIKSLSQIPRTVGIFAFSVTG